MNELIKALCGGKCRGYEESREVGGDLFFFQYAIKKQNDMFCTYCFSVDESCMEFLEDNEGEEVRKFNRLEDALSHLTEKGCVIEKLAAMKKTLPF